MTVKVPTEKQQYWLSHIHACQAQKISMINYAKQQNITPRTFYDAKKALVKKGLLDAPAITKQPTQFQKVSVTPSTTINAVLTFPGGICLEWPMNADTQQLLLIARTLQQLS